MRRWWLSSLIFLLVPTVAARGQTLDVGVLGQLKDASVYIRVLQGGRAISSGSGFVFRVQGDTALVLTNHHVVTPELDEMPRGAKFELSVVFRSGTPGEQEVPAVLLGSIYNKTTDLAILEVKGVKQAPKPIPADQVAAEKDFFETMPVFTLGFPLGEMIQGVIGRNRGNPAITVNSMTIASLRPDPLTGQLQRVQLNGSLIEGNSGGPVVDAKGRLVGVVVSRLRGEAVGFAIPPNVISRFLNGSLDFQSLNVISVAADGIELKLEARVIDPFGNVKSFAIRRAPANKPLQAPGGPITTPLVDDPSPASFAINNGVASSQFKVPTAADGNRKVIFQVMMTDKGGRVMASSPVVIELPNRTGTVANAGREAPERGPARWSCDVNVSDGAEIKHNGDETLIDVPGGSPFINAPQYASFNAPSSLAKVRGNFVASVVVDCSLDPGGETILGPQGKKLPFSFQGAGLLLWQDEGNFVRVERCKGTGGGAGGLIHRALVEVYKNGKELGVYYSDPIPDIPTALAVVRKGASVQFLYSRAPKELVVFQEVAMDLQDDVFIGVAASNLSKRPLHARFREFTLMDLEKKPIDVAKVERDKLVVPKYQTLADGTLVYEGAGMKVLTEQGKSAIPEEGMDAKYQGEWSGGRQLLWRATKKGDGLALEFSVPEGKTFDVQLMLTKGPDYGKAIVLFDGKPANASKPFNMYAEKVQLGKPVSLGVLALNKGTHKLQFRVDGKDDKSTGFTIGVDDLRLVPAKTPAKTDTKTKTETTKPAAKTKS